MDWRKEFGRGLKDGMPICLGYIPVAFTFGFIAVSGGLPVWAAFLISLTNLTSAGQFAGLGIIAAGGPYLELAAAQLIINLRYCLMSCALAQKLPPDTRLVHRFLIAYGVTDEIFGVGAACEGRLSPWYMYGAIGVAMPGWALGTLIGVVCGSVLPARMLSALGVALYGMFLAIILPPARKNRVLAGLVACSMLASLAASRAPLLSQLSGGGRIILLTLALGALAAWRFPLPDEPGLPDGGAAVSGAEEDGHAS